jgi:hypothetical protein
MVSFNPLALTAVAETEPIDYNASTTPSSPSNPASTPVKRGTPVDSEGATQKRGPSIDLTSTRPPKRAKLASHDEVIVAFAMTINRPAEATPAVASEC